MKKTTENTNIKIENEFAKVTISEGSIVIENKGANENAHSSLKDVLNATNCR